MLGQPPRRNVAALGPSEQLTLQVIALGVLKPEKLRARDVARLTQLGLIEQGNGSLTLTETGKLQYRAIEETRRDR